MTLAGNSDFNRLVKKVRKLLGPFKRKCELQYHLLRCRNAPVFKGPTPAELDLIEQELLALGVAVKDYAPSPEDFNTFKDARWFPDDYHGGTAGPVWDEKLLEHWLSQELLNLESYGGQDIFVDIAGSSSPWAKALRERKGLTSYSIDLDPPSPTYQGLPYYRQEDATKTTFEVDSVKGGALHCAYEMFMGDDDTRFVLEAARILQKGGTIVILPLYMHTHYCAYSTPEYYGKNYAPPSAKEYLRTDCLGVPSSRKYDPKTLKERILDPIRAADMEYELLVLRNKSEFGNNIYCHFILKIVK